MMTESEHITQAKTGDSAAFGALYDLYSQKIYAFLLSRIRHKQIAEDLLQDVFVKAWQALPRFQEDKGGFSPWVYRIATNCMNDYFRSKHAKPDGLELHEEIIVEDTAIKPHESFDQSLVQKHVQAAMKHLPETYRQVLILRFNEGLSAEETGKAIKKSGVAVRLIQYRALKKLKIIIKNNYVEALS